MSENQQKLNLENQLCFPLYAASRLTTQIYGPLLKKLDLTYPQYLVMLVMWQYGEQSVNTVGARIHLESNTLTPLLKRLEQKKLLSRRRSESDERSVIISLTDSGLELKQQATEIPGEIINSFDDGSISFEEIKQFHHTLFKLVCVLKQKVDSNK